MILARIGLPCRISRSPAHGPAPLRGAAILLVNTPTNSLRASLGWLWLLCRGVPLSSSATVSAARCFAAAERGTIQSSLKIGIPHVDEMIASSKPPETTSCCRLPFWETGFRARDTAPSLSHPRLLRWLRDRAAARKPAKFAVVHPCPGNLCNWPTAWWSREDSNYVPATQSYRTGLWKSENC